MGRPPPALLLAVFLHALYHSHASKRKGSSTWTAPASFHYLGPFPAAIQDLAADPAAALGGAARLREVGGSVPSAFVRGGHVHWSPPQPATAADTGAATRRRQRSSAAAASSSSFVVSHDGLQGHRWQGWLVGPLVVAPPPTGRRRRNRCHTIAVTGAGVTEAWLHYETTVSLPRRLPVHGPGVGGASAVEVNLQSAAASAVTSAAASAAPVAVKRTAQPAATAATAAFGPSVYVRVVSPHGQAVQAVVTLGRCRRNVSRTRNTSATKAKRRHNRGIVVLPLSVDDWNKGHEYPDLMRVAHEGLSTVSDSSVPAGSGASGDGADDAHTSGTPTAYFAPFGDLLFARVYNTHPMSAGALAGAAATTVFLRVHTSDYVAGAKGNAAHLVPGQAAPLSAAFRLRPGVAAVPITRCPLPVKLSVVVASGSADIVVDTRTIRLRCRRRDEAVTFIYPDFDGSPQIAALRHPLQHHAFPTSASSRKRRLAAPVLLSTHGTSFLPRFCCPTR